MRFDLAAEKLPTAWYNVLPRLREPMLSMRPASSPEPYLPDLSGQDFDHWPLLPAPPEDQPGSWPGLPCSCVL